MADLILPATNDPDSEQEYTLEGVTYTFRYRYNGRAGAWFMDVYTEDGTALITGRKIVVSWILAGFREVGDRLLPGQVYATDTSASDTDPTLEDFGTRVLMKYLESTGWE